MVFSSRKFRHSCFLENYLSEQFVPGTSLEATSFLVWYHIVLFSTRGVHIMWCKVFQGAKCVYEEQSKNNDASLTRDFQGNMNYWFEEEVHELVVHFTHEKGWRLFVDSELPLTLFSKWTNSSGHFPRANPYGHLGWIFVEIFLMVITNYANAGGVGQSPC